MSNSERPSMENKKPSQEEFMKLFSPEEMGRLNEMYQDIRYKDEIEEDEEQKP